MACQEISRKPENQKTVDSLNYKQCPGIIINKLRVFLQNVRKNRILTDLLLETNKNFDIIFI